MMKISRLADYAFLILNHLSQGAEQCWSASALAERSQLTPPTVSKVLKLLHEADLIRSVRGVNGGYCMDKATHEISLAAVIAAVDGDIALTECCQANNHCVHNQHCQTKPRWRLINRALQQVFTQYTLSDLYMDTQTVLLEKHHE